jgi:hypothetical protein
MELFNIENPYYEVWKVGRPSNKALEKRALYWKYEKRLLDKANSPKCANYKFNSIVPKKVKS